MTSRAKSVICATLLLCGTTLLAQLKLDFSQRRGFYENDFKLAVSATDASAEIRYTLDGSEPSTTSGTIYSGSIDISTTTVLRAIGFIPGVDTTKIYTHSYLFLDDVIEQPENIAGWPNSTYNLGSGGATARHDYEMDPSIVNAAAYRDDIIPGLKSIPSLSIVMSKADFWNMYDNDIETKTSIELLYPEDPLKNSQDDCGVEPHSHKRLKRSMRLSFKSEYGNGTWDSDIFRNAVIGGETATDNLDRVVLRGGNNRAWSRNWNADRTAFTRDEWFRQSQIAASGFGSHGTFVHLYVNGLYWGIYNPVERPDASFTSTYFGGEKEDWFARSHGGEKGGDNTRYNYLMNTILSKDLSASNNYEELKEYLDVSAFSDYVLLSWMTGVQDWPGNNWWGGNSNNPPGKFMYFGWDNEWSWDVTKNANNGAWVHPSFRQSQTGGSNSAKVFNKAKSNDDFMMTFADRVYKLCFNNGVMTDDNSRERWQVLNESIEDAVIAESARWGDGLNDGTTRTRDDHWRAEVDRLDGLMNGNVNRLMAALKAENYYPSIDPPLFENAGTPIEVTEIGVSSGYNVDLTNPNGSGDIYYSLSGEDPRLSGGGISPNAIEFDGNEITINESVVLFARIKNGSDWSALHCLSLFVKNTQAALKLTEIMYNPLPKPNASGSELEFLEIKNTSKTGTIDLSGIKIVDGVDYEFPIGTSLAPQEFLVLASNADTLEDLCAANVFGEYQGQLRNSGEKIAFINFEGDTIIKVEYNDKAPWPLEADGEGPSLVSTQLNPIGNQNNPAMWIASFDESCGSPGADDQVSASLEDNQIEEFIIYPNPLKGGGELTIQNLKNPSSISLFNPLGQRVAAKVFSVSGDKTVLEIPQVSGLHTLFITLENGNTVSRSLIVQ